MSSSSATQPSSSSSTTHPSSRHDSSSASHLTEALVGAAAAEKGEDLEGGSTRAGGTGEVAREGETGHEGERSGEREVQEGDGAAGSGAAPEVEQQQAQTVVGQGGGGDGAPAEAAWWMPAGELEGEYRQLMSEKASKDIAAVNARIYYASRMGAQVLRDWEERLSARTADERPLADWQQANLMEATSLPLETWQPRYEAVHVGTPDNPSDEASARNIRNAYAHGVYAWDAARWMWLSFYGLLYTMSPATFEWHVTHFPMVFGVPWDSDEETLRGIGWRDDGWRAWDALQKDVAQRKREARLQELHREQEVRRGETRREREEEQRAGEEEEPRRRKRPKSSGGSRSQSRAS